MFLRAEEPGADAVSRAPAVAPPSDPQIEWSRQQVFVGQQVLLQVSLRHSVQQQPSWEAPSFAGFLVQRLPVQGGQLERDASGRAVRLTRFTEVLFPTRDGVLEVPRSNVLLQDQRGRAVRVGVPATQIVAVAPPTLGRPDAFAGAVGDVSVRIRPERLETDLSSSIAFQVDVLGTVHPSQLPSLDFEALLGDSAEIYPRPGKTSIIDRQGELVVRRTYRFDLVGRAAGELRLPALSIPYFDPLLRTYREATTDPLRIVVHDASDLSEPALRADGGASREDDPRSDDGASPGAPSVPGATSIVWERLPYLWAGFRVVAVVAAFAAFGAYRRRRGRRIGQPNGARGARAGASTDASSPISSVTPADSTLPGWLDQTTEPDSSLRAELRAAIVRRHGTRARSWTARDLERQQRDPEAAELLTALDRLQFAPAPEGDVDARLVERVRSYVAGVLHRDS